MIKFTGTDALSKKNSWVGIAMTILLIGLGIYVAVKHYKTPGFWYGVLALFLVYGSVTITDNKTSTST